MFLHFLRQAWQTPLLGLLFMLSPTMAWAQGSQSKDTADVPENVEIIEVVGRKPLTFYRKQLRTAENNFIDILNGLTTDDDFKITCRFESYRERTRIKKRVCSRAYERRINGEELEEAIFFNGILSAERLADDRIAKRVSEKAAEEFEHTKKLLEQSPELRKALLAYVEANQAFETRRKQMFE